MRNFKRHLREVVSEIFEAAYDMDICNFTEEELAAKAGLAVTTVWRLRTGQTKEPRYSTIFKLAKAVKMDLGLLKEALAHV